MERILEIDTSLRGTIGIVELNTFLVHRLESFFAKELLFRLAEEQFDIIKRRSRTDTEDEIILEDFVAALEEDSTKRALDRASIRILLFEPNASDMNEGMTLSDLENMYESKNVLTELEKDSIKRLLDKDMDIILKDKYISSNEFLYLIGQSK
eukprot:378449_1